MTEYVGNGCVQCPRRCGVNRAERVGFCGVGERVKLARVGLHLWEEPCLSFGNGSGTVFFSGCSLRCVFCQNREISRGGKGSEVDIPTLADEFLRLQEMGAVNINLVTPTHYTAQIVRALDRVKAKLHIPVCYNCGGYERVETLRQLDGYVDIFLPDIKYYSPEYAAKYSAAPDYFEIASAALAEMYRLVGYAAFDEAGHMTRGVLTRHLVLPGLYRDSMRILDALSGKYEPARFAVSILNQYFPTPECAAYPEINRRVTTLEYRKVTDYALSRGFTLGFTQQRSAHEETYVPAFDYSVPSPNRKE